MKKLIFASLALLLVFAAVPVMADNSSDPAAFQALSNLTDPGQVALDQMTDKQLASVEGQNTSISVATIASCDDCNNLYGWFYTVFDVSAY